MHRMFSNFMHHHIRKMPGLLIQSWRKIPRNVLNVVTFLSYHKHYTKKTKENISEKEKSLSQNKWSMFSNTWKKKKRCKHKNSWLPTTIPYMWRRKCGVEGSISFNQIFIYLLELRTLRNIKTNRIRLWSLDFSFLCELCCLFHENLDWMRHWLMVVSDFYVHHFFPFFIAIKILKRNKNFLFIFHDIFSTNIIKGLQKYFPKKNNKVYVYDKRYMQKFLLLKNEACHLTLTHTFLEIAFAHLICKMKIHLCCDFPKEIIIWLDWKSCILKKNKIYIT